MFRAMLGAHINVPAGFLSHSESAPGGRCSSCRSNTAPAVPILLDKFLLSAPALQAEVRMVSG
jgi:hypothetical protein